MSWTSKMTAEDLARVCQKWDAYELTANLDLSDLQELGRKYLELKEAAQQIFELGGKSQNERVEDYKRLKELSSL